MVIQQGDVFWVSIRTPLGAEPGFRRPVVVIQNNAFNASAIRTAVCCAITSNLSLAEAPGNVRLARGEARLPKPCVVNVSQIVTVDKAMLTEKIGQIAATRLREVMEGVQLVLRIM